MERLKIFKINILLLALTLAVTINAYTQVKKTQFNAYKTLVRLTDYIRQGKLKESEKLIAIPPNSKFAWRKKELLEDLKKDYKIFRIEYFSHNNKMKTQEAPISWDKICKIYSITVVFLDNNEKKTICFSDDGGKIIKYYVKCCDSINGR